MQEVWNYTIHVFLAFFNCNISFFFTFIVDVSISLYYFPTVLFLHESLQNCTYIDFKL